MALITCPECGRRITDQEERCIGCGLTIAKIRKNQIRALLNDKSLRCIVCGTEFNLKDCRCPKCGYPAMYFSPALDLQKSIAVFGKDIEAQENTDQTITDDVEPDIDKPMPTAAEPEEPDQSFSGEEERTDAKADETEIKPLILYDERKTRNEKKKAILIVAILLLIIGVAVLRQSGEEKNEYAHDIFELYGYYDASSGEFILDDDYLCDVVIHYVYDKHIEEYVIWYIEMKMWTSSYDKIADSKTLTQAYESIIKKYDMVYKGKPVDDEDWKEWKWGSNEQVSLTVYDSKIDFRFYKQFLDVTEQVDVFGMEITDDNIDQIIDKMHSVGFTDRSRAQFPQLIRFKRLMKKIL